MTDISHLKLIPYDPYWCTKFETEKLKIEAIFKDKALGIEHIGSTSVKGLMSKPIIDLAVKVANPEIADLFIDPLAKIKYRYEERSSSSERHFFRKGNPTEFHCSICYKDRGSYWERQILFRDYLRNHPEALSDYQELKIRLLEKYPTGRGGYVSGKTEFVEKILILARIAC